MKLRIQKYRWLHIIIRVEDPNVPILGYLYFNTPNNITYSLWNYQDVVPRSKFIKDVLHPERRYD